MTEITYKSKEAKFTAEVISLFKDSIKNPTLTVLMSALSSLVKAVDSSESLQKTFAKIFDYIKANWNNEDRHS